MNIWNLPIGIMISVFANGPGELDSISGRVLPKTLLNTQNYKDNW